MMTEFNKWKIWNGGKCPVDPDTKVQVQLGNESRDEALKNDVEKACDWGWGRCGEEQGYTSIIAYRTVKEPVVETKDGECFFVHFTYSHPSLIDEGYSGAPSNHGKYTTTLKDGKPVRFVWEADE